MGMGIPILRIVLRPHHGDAALGAVGAARRGEHGAGPVAAKRRVDDERLRMEKLLGLAVRAQGKGLFVFSVE